MGHPPVVLGAGRQGPWSPQTAEVERLGQHGQGSVGLP